MPKKIDEILSEAVARRCSDIHFSAEETVWTRLDGDLVKYDDTVYSHAELETLLTEILDQNEREKLTKHKNLDKSYYIENVGNFRVNMFYTRRGIGSVIRTLPSKMPTIAQLGLPEVVRTLAELPKGLILVTGPTGSGKSTTLAAIINHMNENFGYHILTAEDPVEFIHPCKKSLINQREIGQSCPTFADALKYALREDPDVILVGEMRDLETISLALTAAETGHLVLGTLHTRGAASTIDRVIESFPAMQQPMVRAMLAESLQAVISQTLVKKAGGTGRVAAYEIMVMNFAISNLVREGKTFQIPSAIQTGRKEGMLLMEGHLKELAASGQITQEDCDSIVASISRGSHTQKAGATSGGGGQPPVLSGSSASAPPPMKSAMPTAPAAPKPMQTAPPAGAPPKVAAAPPKAPVPAAANAPAKPAEKPVQNPDAEQISMGGESEVVELISLSQLSDTGLTDLANMAFEDPAEPPVLRPAMVFKKLDEKTTPGAAAAPAATASSPTPVKPSAPAAPAAAVASKPAAPVAAKPAPPGVPATPAKPPTPGMPSAPAKPAVPKPAASAVPPPAAARPIPKPLGSAPARPIPTAAPSAAPKPAAPAKPATPDAPEAPKSQAMPPIPPAIPKKKAG